MCWRTDKIGALERSLTTNTAYAERGFTLHCLENVDEAIVNRNSRVAFDSRGSSIKVKGSRLLVDEEGVVVWCYSCCWSSSAAASFIYIWMWRNIYSQQTQPGPAELSAFKYSLMNLLALRNFSLEHGYSVNKQRIFNPALQNPWLRNRMPKLGGLFSKR
jgi:hypothetical protein